jgi:preprotein translocase subunit SecE
VADKNVKIEPTKKLAQPAVRTVQKEKRRGKLARWWHETLGELHKVAWPTPRDAWRLTKIVLVVMAGMGILLGFLDFIFSHLVTLLLT